MGWRELALWASAAILANNLAADLAAPHDAGLGLSWLWRSRFGLFDALAWGVGLSLIWKGRPRPAAGRDVALALMLSLVAGAPQHMAAPVALTGLAAWLLRSRTDEIRAAGAVYLAIASHQLWSYLVFQLFSPELVKLDAAMVGEAVSLTVKGAVWRGDTISVPGGHAVSILEACCSFSNVSTSLLAWVALAKWERPAWAPRDLWVALAAVFCQVGLNVARLYLIAQSAALYAYWHDGAGAQIYGLTASVAAVLIGVFGTRWASPRPLPAGEA